MAYQTNFKNTIWAGAADQPYQHADATEVTSSVQTQPGKLVRYNIDGDIVQGGSPNAFLAFFVVLENGSHLGGSVDEVIEAGETFSIAFPRSGELFNGLVIGANTTQVGELFTQSASGHFASVGNNDGTEQVQFMCMEETAATAEDRLVLFKKL